MRHVFVINTNTICYKIVCNPICLIRVVYILLNNGLSRKTLPAHAFAIL